MIKLQILSRYAVTSRSQLGERMCDHCISIVDPGQDMDRASLKGFRRVLRLRFYDIEDEGTATESERKHLPTVSHVRSAIRFFRRWRTEANGFTVHCHAGVHRSTAIGTVLLYLELRDEQTVMEELLKIHPLPLPNRRMIRFADQLLGADLSSVANQLWTRGERFLRGEISINRDDYLDELSPVE